MNLEINNITKKFKDKTIIENLSFHLNQDDDFYIYLKGASGSGKTTLLNIIGNMLNADAGDIKIDSKPISELKDYRTNYVTYLPCGNSLLESLTILENIQYASNCTSSKAYELLNKLKLDDIENSYPREISSGEYKRVCFARALAMNTPFYLLDEPTSNLDEKSAEIIVEIINDLAKEKGIIIATHDSRLMNGKEICIN